MLKNQLSINHLFGNQLAGNLLVSLWPSVWGASSGNAAACDTRTRITPRIPDNAVNTLRGQDSSACRPVPSKSAGNQEIFVTNSTDSKISIILSQMENIL